MKRGAALTVLAAVLLAGATAPALARTELRDEYSIRYVADDGTVTAYVFAAPVCRKTEAGEWELLDPDLPRLFADAGRARTEAARKRTVPPQPDNLDGTVVTPNPEPFHTGTVYGNHGEPQYFSDDILRFAGGVGGADNQYRAWARFNTGSIPDQAQVSRLVFHLYCYDAVEPWYNLTPVATDPVQLPPNELYDEIARGTPYSQHQSITWPGWNNYELPEQARTDFQDRLAEDWWAVGVHEWDAEQQGWYYGAAYGWGNSSHQPYV